MAIAAVSDPPPQSCIKRKRVTLRFAAKFKKDYKLMKG